MRRADDGVLGLLREHRTTPARRFGVRDIALFGSLRTEIWLSEAERYAREIDCGEVQPVSAEEVRREARALLR